jgi:hypothetical protein
MEIVKAKMEAWGKIVYPKAVLPDRSKPPLRASHIVDEATVFCVSGCTSSFVSRGQRIELKGISPRKLDMGPSPMARLARAMWEAGSQNADEEYIVRTRQNLFRPEKNEIASFFRQLPMWINDHIDRVRNLPKERRQKRPRRRAGDLIYV